MQNDEVTMCNACTDLVGMKKLEAFPLQLLGSKRSGEWVRVREFCLQVGVAPGELRLDLFATWLPDPMGHDGYAVIMFYVDESKWTMTAHYNRARLLGSGSLNQVPQPTGVSISTSPASTPQQASPAAKT